MLALGKMDGAWAFWQRCCCLQWQLPDSEGEHWRENEGGVDEQQRRGKDWRDKERRMEREIERVRGRKREGEGGSDGVCPPRWKFFLRNVAWLANGTLAAPGTSTLSLFSALCPSRPFPATMLATSCDAFGAPRLVIRVIYTALIAAR